MSNPDLYYVQPDETPEDGCDGEECGECLTCLGVCRSCEYRNCQCDAGNDR